MDEVLGGEGGPIPLHADTLRSLPTDDPETADANRYRLDIYSYSKCGALQPVESHLFDSEPTLEDSQASESGITEIYGDERGVIKRVFVNIRFIPCFTIVPVVDRPSTTPAQKQYPSQQN